MAPAENSGAPSPRDECVWDRSRPGAHVPERSELEGPELMLNSILTSCYVRQQQKRPVILRCCQHVHEIVDLKGPQGLPEEALFRQDMGCLANMMDRW